MANFTLELRAGLRPTYSATLQLEDADAAKWLAIRFLGDVLRDEPHLLDDGAVVIRVTGPEGLGFDAAVRIEDCSS